MTWAKRVLFKSSLSAYSGYGNDGLGLSIALQDGGYDVALVPTHVSPPLPAQVAALLTRGVEPPYDFVLDHADPDSLGLSSGESSASPKRIGWTMWEFLGLGGAEDHETKVDGRLLKLKERLGTYDMVLVYDEVTRAALEPVLSGQEVKKLQGGYWSKGWMGNPQDRDWSGTFRYCMVGQLHARKNPWAAIEAFDILKQRHGDAFDAELHLKTSVRSLHPSMERRYQGLKIHYTSWPKKQLKEFYYKCHTYLAPSWGEGKNLPALEAQTTGIPVIGTNFGGQAEWMGDHSYAVDFDLEAHEPGMLSARVNVEHLSELMWQVYTNREETKAKGDMASKIIPAMCDWEKVVARLGDLTRG